MDTQVGTCAKTMRHYHRDREVPRYRCWKFNK